VFAWSTGDGQVGGMSTARSGRYIPAIVVTAIGVGLSILSWTRAMEERQVGVGNVLGSLADETTSTIEAQLDREVNALRDLATFWQLHGLMSERPWSYHTRVTMEYFPGIQWIAWLPPDSTRARFLARDGTARPEPGVLGAARRLGAEPSPLIQERWGEAFDLRVFLPVGSPHESVAMLAGAIRVDSLWLREHMPPTGNLSVKLTSDKGRELVLRAAPAGAPHWTRLRRVLNSPSGTRVEVELVPRPEFLQHIATPWPNLFLVTGIFLSIAIGVVMVQFQRSREYSGVLAGINRSLDLRIAELSRRDLELNALNNELDERVRVRTEELTNALREVETFSHSVSHDLRSPIGAILNYTAVVEEEYGSKLDDEGRRLLERIRGAGLRANQLLGALMEYATSGVSLHKPTVLDMRAIAEGGYAEAVARENDARDVEFTVDDLPPAFADAVQVHRIFSNLIGNAVKYSRGRSPRGVDVHGRANGVECTYWVHDNGPGFDPARAPEIFEPSRSLLGDPAGGTRLGLATVAKIVHRQGGRVWAESDGKTGATFYFTLPTAGRRNDEGSSGPPRR